MAIILSHYNGEGNKTYPHVLNFYEELHEKNNINNLLNKLGINKASVDADVATAKELERVLNNIKKDAKMLLADRENHLGGLTAAAQFLDSIMPKDLLEMLFGKEQVKLTNYKSGILFEEFLDKLITGTLSKLSEEEILSSQAGQKLVTVGELFSIEDLKRQFSKKLLPFVLENVVTEIKKDENGQSLFKLNAKQQKTDIETNGLGVSLKLEFEGGQDYIDLFNIFSKANINISAKNYKSKNNKLYVKIGSTSNLRVFIAALSYLMKDAADEDIKTIFFATRNSRNKNLQIHKNHLRFIYELTGAGLRADDGSYLKLVDYLIVNERGGEHIYVLSTKKLIQDVLQAEELSAYQSTHVIINYANDK